MHALEWIQLYGTKLRSISSGKLRHVLHRQKCQCTWCGEQVKKPRRLWCSQACVDAYLERQPNLCSKLAYQRDRGICQLCGVDANRIASLMLRLTAGLSDAKSPDWVGVRKAYVQHLNRIGFPIKNQRGYTFQLTQADHILPVCEGGGLCTLEGYRTVCVPCHTDITRRLNQQRAAAKRQKKCK